MANSHLCPKVSLIRKVLNGLFRNGWMCSLQDVHFQVTRNPKVLLVFLLLQKHAHRSTVLSLKNNTSLCFGIQVLQECMYNTIPGDHEQIFVYLFSHRMPLLFLGGLFQLLHSIYQIMYPGISSWSPIPILIRFADPLEIRSAGAVICPDLRSYNKYWEN